MKILLVDDSKRHCQAGLADLMALGHEVIVLRDYSDVAMVVRQESFDVALIDLLMPAEAMTLGGEGMSHLGESFAVGYPLAVYLATQGIRVAVATDTNHHHHPASAMMDWLASKEVNINGRRVCFMHAPMKQIDGVWVKDWSAVLDRLLGTTNKS